MRQATPNVRAMIAAALCACGAVGGCYKTASQQPFAREDPEVRVEGLAAITAGALGQVGESLRDTMRRLGGASPKYLAHARTLASPDSTPDALREALLGLAEYEHGREPPYTEAYAQFARGSQHALVRASAVRALSISRHAESTPLFIELLDDPDMRVRLEAAKALANVPDDAAIEPLIAVATSRDEDIDVRIATVDALKHYESAEARRALVALLEAEEFSLSWQARRSLVTGMKQDHGFDVEAWRQAVG